MVLLWTQGFVSAAELTQHWADHGAALGLLTEEDYEDAADRFMGAPLEAGVLDCVKRTRQRYVRYRAATAEYGVMTPDRRHIVTYMRIHPGPGGHRYATNDDYFVEDCNR